MRLNLIPAPQRLQIIDEDVFSISDFGKIFLSEPKEDIRLKLHAENVFGPIFHENRQQKKFYCLYSEGMDSNESRYRETEKKDSYILTVKKAGFYLAAVSASGLFYGLQTLKQLLEHRELPPLEIEDWADVPLRSDYLDLRTIFPPFERILYFIRELSYYKINTLVIEYEDKIPFQTMNFMRHPTDCFTEEELARLLAVAKENFIEIIPLQQSFGHLEYALKYPQYIHLRETPGTPGEMCPLRSGSVKLAKALLSDTSSLHPESRYLHLGCDEVWSLGTSTECVESGKTRELLFIEFVNQLIDHVCSFGKIPIIWHDMFAHATEEELERLDKRVLVAVWLYNDSDMPVKAKKIAAKLEKAGISYLGCSSVRCWDNKPEQNYPEIDNRLLNLDLWCQLAEELPVKGLIHTNWGSSFSFGRPYGLFETSRYPLFYAAELSWNMGTDREDFLYRFLFLYHGMNISALIQRGYRNRDYYRLMHSQSKMVLKNRETADLIRLMIDLEFSFPVMHTMFRCDLYPESEVELACLKERSVTALKRLEKVEKELMQFIPSVLSESMSELFLESRFYLYRMAKKRLIAILEERGEEENETV